MIRAETPILAQVKNQATSPLSFEDAIPAGSLMLLKDPESGTGNRDRLLLGMGDHSNPYHSRVVVPFSANEVITEGSPRLADLMGNAVRNQARNTHFVETGIIANHKWSEVRYANSDGSYWKPVRFNGASAIGEIEYIVIVNGVVAETGEISFVAGPSGIFLSDRSVNGSRYNTDHVGFEIVRDPRGFVLMAYNRTDPIKLLVRYSYVSIGGEDAARNRPPVWQSDSDLGTISTSLSVHAVDPEGYPVTYRGLVMPTGLTITAQGEIQVNGVTGGIHTIVLEASDGVEVSRKEFVIKVNNVPIWHTPAGRLGMYGPNTVVNYQLSASDQDEGQVITYSVISGSLPSGITMNSEGLLSGALGGDGTFTVRASDGEFHSDRQFSIEMNSPPVWQTATNLGAFIINTAINVQLTATDPDNDPITYSAVGQMPSGLSLSANGRLTGTISASGSFTAKVTDSNNTSSERTYTYTANAYPVWQTAASLGTFEIGKPMSRQLTASHPLGYPVTYTSSQIPAGLTLSPSGLLSGTPTSPANANFNVVASDGTLTATRQFQITMVAAPVWVTPAGVVGNILNGTSVNIQLSATTASGGTLSYAIVSGSLPTGLSMTTAGRITGTMPSSSGTFTVRVTDSATGFVSANREFIIRNNTIPVWITEPDLGLFRSNTIVSKQLVAQDPSGGTLTYSVSTAMPKSLTVSSTALLSGIIRPVTPEYIEFAIGANTLVEVYINGTQTNDFLVNGAAYNPPLAVGRNWAIVDTNMNLPTVPVDDSYLVQYGSDVYFRSKPEDAPFITDGEIFRPTIGTNYTITYMARKISHENNGNVPCFRPAFDAIVEATGTQDSAMGIKNGQGYNPANDLIEADGWALNQWYMMTASWTPTVQYSRARGRLRVNRSLVGTPPPGPPSPWSNAVFEIELAAISAGEARPPSTLSVRAPSVDAVIRVVTRPILNPEAIADDKTHLHYPVTSDTNTFTVAATDSTPDSVSRTFTTKVYDPELPLMHLNYVTTEDEYQTAISTPLPHLVNYSVEVNNWARFNGISYYANSAAAVAATDYDAMGWKYNIGRVTNTGSVTSFNGLISPSATSQFTRRLNAASSSSEKNISAYIIAFALVNGVPNSLVAWRARGGAATPTTWAIAHVVGNTVPPTILVDGSTTAPASASDYWGHCVIDVVRDGNSITAKCSQFGSTVIDEATTIQYTIPAGSIFAGDKPTGYGVWGQPETAFSDAATGNGLDRTVIYDARTPNNIKIMVYNPTTGTWVQDLSRTINRDIGYPRNFRNPRTGSTWRITGPRPYAITLVSTGIPDPEPEIPEEPAPEWLYNYQDGARLTTFRNALAALKANTSDATILFVGDDYTLGAGAGNNTTNTFVDAYPNSISSKAASKVTSVPTSIDSRVGTGSVGEVNNSANWVPFHHYDTSFFMVDGFDQATAVPTFGGRPLRSTTTNTSEQNQLILRPRKSWDTFKVCYLGGPSSTGYNLGRFTVRSAESTVHTITPSAQNQFVHTHTSTYSSPGPFTIITTDFTGNNQVAMILGWRYSMSTEKRLHFVNAGAIGANTSTGVNGYNANLSTWSAGAGGSSTIWENTLTVICMGINDMISGGTGISPATYKSQMFFIMNRYTNFSSIILCVPPEHSSTIQGPHPFSEFRAVLYELADSFNIPLIDFSALLGSYDTSVANGTQLTTKYPNKDGYDAMAGAVAEIISDLIDKTN